MSCPQNVQNFKLSSLVPNHPKWHEEYKKKKKVMTKSSKPCPKLYGRKKGLMPTYLFSLA